MSSPVIEHPTTSALTTVQQQVVIRARIGIARWRRLDIAIIASITWMDETLA
jgi:hypothetical protein